MRVLQLIDSLDAGGAERVAVNFANGLSELQHESFLCATRKEGLLKQSIDSNVGYLFLTKVKAIDFKALFKLKTFIKQNKINLVHAHSTSVFTAVLVKLLGAKIKIVWHDHYGKSDFLNERPSKILKFCGHFINYVFGVNDQLVDWSKSVLKIDYASYLPNFVTYSEQKKETVLKGNDSDIKIVCLANLRPQKDHFNLINAFTELKYKVSNCTLHLIGKDFKDDYSRDLKKLIEEMQLSEHVFVYGSCYDTFQILKQAQIGVLSSKSEGLPLSLLEYGISKLPVVCTNVGDCSKVITNHKNGLLVDSEDVIQLSESLHMLVTKPILAENMGLALAETIHSSYSKNAVLKEVVKIYNKL